MKEEMRGFMQDLKKKYQVFISSTYEDLKDERAAVTQCLLDEQTSKPYPNLQPH